MFDASLVIPKGEIFVLENIDINPCRLVVPKTGPTSLFGRYLMKLLYPNIYSPISVIINVP